MMVLCCRLVRCAMIGFASRQGLTAKAKWSSLLRLIRPQCRERYDVSLSVPPIRREQLTPRKAVLDRAAPARFMPRGEAAARWEFGFSLLFARLALREWRRVQRGRRRHAAIHHRLIG